MLPQPPSSSRSPPIPANHFLALQPSYSQPTASFPSGLPSTSSHGSNGLAPNTASLASADFDVDVRTGFLPGRANVTRLDGVWEVWEEALDAAKGPAVGAGLTLGGRGAGMWRQGVQSMPVLDTTDLRASLPHLRRAHVVLTFLAHFYVHTTAASREPIPIPASVSVPLLTISPLLGLPPVLTYADTVLYNFLPVNPALAPSWPINPPHSALTTFTNTRSEEQFYVISALCEIAGAEALRLMRQSLDELFIADEKAIRRLTVYLRKLAVQIDLINSITQSMMTEVDPEEFYHLIRPWFRGGDADGPESAGWDYLGLTGEPTSSNVAAESSNTVGRRGKLYSGPSAGQSSLIHAIDIFLTVDHSPTPEERAATLASVREPAQPASVPGQETQAKIILNASPIVPGQEPAPAAHGHAGEHGGHGKPASEATFLQRMLQYMPLPHRSFLLHLSTHPTPLRELVINTATSHPALAASYDVALEALRNFREKHMRVVSLFIVQQARRRPSARVRRLLGEEVDEEVEGFAEVRETGELRGTGGTALFKFLKRCRDNVTNAMVRPSGAGYELE